MSLLSNDKILDVYRRAIQERLHLKRSVLLAGLAPAYVAGLEVASSPADQLLLDLRAMNETPKIIGDVTPLHHWLVNASSMAGAFPDRQRFYGELADEAARQAGEGTPAPGDLPARMQQLPERIIFKNDLVPAAFVAGAARTSLSVARIAVPQFDAGVPRLDPSSGVPLLAYGTAWLVGPGFLLTNWHVIEARAPGESPAAIEDVRRQCEGAVAEFDYDSLDGPRNAVPVAGVAHGDPRLDYAVLRLGAPLDRAPLPLREAALFLEADASFPVNVVQHPGAAPKQFGIRNNLVAALRDDDLAYYTDTAGGSSGSPVCDDQWQVIALHKASSLSFGTLNFQGKDTVWVNIGTLIRAIIDDLRANQPELWAEIAAVLV